jgi:hypothetical protein
LGLLAHNNGAFRLAPTSKIALPCEPEQPTKKEHLHTKIRLSNFQELNLFSNHRMSFNVFSSQTTKIVVPIETTQKLFDSTEVTFNSIV